MSTNRTRQAPPPVVDPNPPRPRPVPPAQVPEADNAPANLAAAAATTGTAPAPVSLPVPPAVEQARPEPQGDLLASLLASGPPQAAGSAAPMSDGAAMLLNLAAMRQQQVDPMTDYVADGTRLLRWVQAAMQHYASLTGITQQQVLADVMLGRTAIPDELLDAHYLHLYKTARPRT